MIRANIALYIGVVTFLCFTYAVGVNAAMVKTDLLGGLGDFEFSADTNYQIAASPIWLWGYKEATVDDSVAPGWVRLTDYNVVPEVNTIYRIEQRTGINGSNSQFFALKGLTSGSNYAVLMYPIKVQDDKSYEIHHGDQLTFRIDRISMTDFKGLPSGTTVSYKLIIRCGTTSGNVYTTTTLTPSSIASSGEVSAPVLVSARTIYLYVQIQTNGGLGKRMPGIRIDGAHLYIKRSGSDSYSKEQVPVPRERGINTQMIFFRSDSYDPYEIAKNYDAVMLQLESEYPWALRLKYYNPSIKVFLFEVAGSVSDFRDENLNDPWYSNCPIPFGKILESHIDWLYPWPEGYTIPEPPGDQRRSDLRSVCYLFELSYQYLYYVRTGNEQYQSEWAASTKDKATRYHLDGVFCDTLVAISNSSSVPLDQKYSEPQSFEHAVYPILRQAKLISVQNCCTGHLDTAPGMIYFDPWWKPTRDYPTSQGYEINNPETTPDVFFQEWAFFRHWPTNGVDQNQYEIDYWLACLNDMEIVTKWNESLPYATRKRIYMMVRGIDRSEDPATGVDGWANFGLCSFLLAQSDYAYFGVDEIGNSESNMITMDLASTEDLGKPFMPRKVLTTDKTLQCRIYSRGIVVVNGSPNKSQTFSMKMALGFSLPGYPSITLKPHTGRIIHLL